MFTIRSVFVIVILLSGCIEIADAQNIEFPDSLPSANKNGNTTKPVKKLNYNFELGTGYVGSKYFSGAYTSFAPKANYMVTPKLNFEAGSIFLMNNISFNSNSPYGKFYNGLQPANQSLLFANGNYALTNRLSITGAAFKSFNMSNSSKSNMYLNDLKGVNLGVNYKISENFHVGANFEYSNRNNDLFYNNFGNGFTNGFSNGFDSFPSNW